MFSFGLFTLPGLFSAPAITNSNNLQAIPSQPLPLPNYGYRTGRSLLWNFLDACDSDSCLEGDMNSSLSSDFVPVSTLLTIDDVLEEESNIFHSLSVSNTNHTFASKHIFVQPICEDVF